MAEQNFENHIRLVPANLTMTARNAIRAYARQLRQETGRPPGML